MFKKPVPAVLHLLVYGGFILINIEVLEILLDGALGKHRLFQPLLGGLYPVVIGFFEVLATLVLISVIIFWIRRNVLKVKRLNQAELAGWPKNDANMILYAEIVLMTMLLIMNTAEGALRLKHGETGGTFFITNHFTHFFTGFSNGTLEGIERFCWWGHIVGIFAYLNYLPYSKHFHIILAFPNAYFTRLTPQGIMKNMPEIQNEVLYMMEPEKAPVPAEGEEPPPPAPFGAKDVEDLSWKNLLDAYSCTECGRCTAACPANITARN